MLGKPLKEVGIFSVAKINFMKWLLFLETSLLLINLNDAVDLPREPKASEESNSSCQQEEEENHNRCVANVQESRCSSPDLQFRHKVVDTVDEKVKCREPAGKEASPPPMIILCAEMEIAKEDGRLRTGDDEDDKHQK